jgi:histidine triad (HIT) family protein
MMKTIFEKIRDKEISSYMIYEDDLVMAFLDISQATKGHTLVVPKTAYPNFLSCPSDVLSRLMEVTQTVTNAIEKTLKPKGFNVLHNIGEVAGQTVFHCHFHIIPRYESDDISLHFHPKERPDSAQFQSLLNSIQVALS